jgi:dihydroflavonol-4-reductase
MRLAVTGASGLLGANILRCAHEAGHGAVALARAGSRCDTAEALGVPVIRADLTAGPDLLAQALAGAETVIHTAATFSYHDDPASLHAIAVEGTRAVLEAAARAGVRRAVVTSSSVVFGYAFAPEPIDENAGLADTTGEPPYVAAKTAQHRAALEVGERTGLEVVLACPTMSLGPTASTLGPSNGLILAYLADRTRSTYAGGCNLVSARDVAQGHVLLAERGEPGRAYLLGANNMTWRAIHNEIGRLTGVGGPRLEISPALALLAAGAEETAARLAGRPPLSTRTQAGMLGRYYWYDDSRARALGYVPRPAAEALLETIAWLVASPHVSRELRTTIRLADEVHRWRYRR